MFSGRAVLIALLSVWLLGSAALAVEVTAIGFGSDKTSAIDDAKRNAVSKVVGEFIDSRSLVKNFQLVNDEILTSSSGYVKSFVVTRKNSLPGGQYEVTIVAQVEETALKDDTGRIQVLSARRGFPRFVVVPDKEAMKNKNIDPDCVIAAGDGIESDLAGRGFGTILAPYHMIERGFTDPSALADLSQWAANLGAEYIVYFIVSEGDAPAGRVFQRKDARVNATVVHTGTYRVIANVVTRGQGGDQNADFAGDDACRTAGENAAAQAADAVLSDWSRTGTIHGNELTLEVRGIPADSVISVEGALKDDGHVKQVNLVRKDDAGAVYQVRIDGTNYDLGNAFEQVASDMNWQVILSSASPTGMTYVVMFE